MPNMTRDRAEALVLWAAKCHVHSRRTHLPLGRLPHSEAEVEEAIEVLSKPRDFADHVSGAVNGMLNTLAGRGPRVGAVGDGVH